MEAAAAAESLERSFRASCSISDGSTGTPAVSSPENDRTPDALINLSNSCLSLPFDWEQCLDLKTGEVYYMDWRSGKKAKMNNYGTVQRISFQEEVRSPLIDDEDPHENQGDDNIGESEDDDHGYYCSSSCSSTEDYLLDDDIEEDEEERAGGRSSSDCMSSNGSVVVAGDNIEGDVLVVGGCKRCLMYFMIPKMADECPKCCSQLLLRFNAGSRS